MLGSLIAKKRFKQCYKADIFLLQCHERLLIEYIYIIFLNFRKVSLLLHVITYMEKLILLQPAAVVFSVGFLRESTDYHMISTLISDFARFMDTVVHLGLQGSWNRK